MESLIDLGSNVNTRDGTNKTALIWAASNGNLSIVVKLLDSNALIEASDNSEATPLFFASEGGYIDIVKLLVEKGGQH